MSARSLRRTMRVVVRAVGGFAAFLLIGNLVILSMHGIARAEVGIDRIDGLAGIDKVRHIDAKLWAGAHPSHDGYRNLAAARVRTIVDLRAEEDAGGDDAYIRSLGIDLVHLAIRDGQTPTDAAVEQFVDIVDASPGTVFVHCGAGVGRTGSMTSAYLVATGQASSTGALMTSLAVGPPSLEQVFYIGRLNGGHRPPAPVVAVSRVLDAPRRIWSSLR